MDTIFANAFVGVFDSQCQCQKEPICNQIYCDDCDTIFCYNCFVDNHFAHHITDVISQMQIIQSEIQKAATSFDSQHRQLMNDYPERFLLALLLYDAYDRKNQQYNPQIVIPNDNILLPLIVRDDFVEIDHFDIIKTHGKNCIKQLREMYQRYRETAEKEIQRISQFDKLHPKTPQDKLICARQFIKYWKLGHFGGDSSNLIALIESLVAE